MKQSKTKKWKSFVYADYQKLMQIFFAPVINWISLNISGYAISKKIWNNEEKHDELLRTVIIFFLSNF